MRSIRVLKFYEYSDLEVNIYIEKDIMLGGFKKIKLELSMEFIILREFS